jgi:hypothetical protein
VGEGSMAIACYPSVPYFARPTDQNACEDLSGELNIDEAFLNRFAEEVRRDLGLRSLRFCNSQNRQLKKASILNRWCDKILRSVTKSG